MKHLQAVCFAYIFCNKINEDGLEVLVRNGEENRGKQESGNEFERDLDLLLLKE